MAVPLRVAQTGKPGNEKIVFENSGTSYKRGPLASGRAITKLPAQDLDRARAFYRDKLGLSPVEEREGGLRYLCAAGEFTFSSRREPPPASRRSSGSRSTT